MSHTFNNGNDSLNPADYCRRIVGGLECGKTASEHTSRYCAICGEPEGSPYAKNCCWDDQMIDDGGEEE